MIGKKQAPSTLLGLSFEGSKLHVAHVRRAGDSFEVLKTLSLDLPAHLLTADPNAVGQEIRNATREAGINENRCVVALPLNSVLSLQTKLPELAEEDVEDFLALEAERNFAYDPDSLFISSSRSQFSSGDRFALIAGIQRDKIENLQAALRAAHFRPLSITLGIAAVQQVYAPSDPPLLLLKFGQRSLELGINSGSSLLAMRSIENAVAETDTAQSGGFQPNVVGRELRLTLGQLTPEVRGGLLKAVALGNSEAIALIRNELAARLRAMGIELEPANATTSRAPIQPEAGAAVSAITAAAGFLARRNPGFQFLPPKVSPWKEFTGKASSKKLAWAAGIAAGIALVLIFAFIAQGLQLSRLQSRWSTMAPRVTQLQELQQQVKRFRPWFDNSYRSLSIVRRLTEAFPVDGVVTAKTLEIRNQNQVTCSGVARDNQALFKMLDQLRSTKEVADVKMDQIRGKSPLQFSFNFRWVEGGAGEH